MSMSESLELTDMHGEEKRMVLWDFKGHGNPRGCVRSYKNLGLMGAGTNMFLLSMIGPLNEVTSILVTLLHVFQLKLQTTSAQCLFCNTNEEHFTLDQQGDRFLDWNFLNRLFLYGFLWMGPSSESRVSWTV